jgi:hypothetical protein
MTRRLAAVLVAAALTLSATAAAASTDPGYTPPSVATPGTPIVYSSVRAPFVCQYDLEGPHQRTVGVGLPVGVQGRNQRVVIEITHPYSAVAVRMPRKGYVRHTFPLPLLYRQIMSVTVGGHVCEVA